MNIPVCRSPDRIVLDAEAPNIPIPGKKRVPFGWQAKAIDKRAGLGRTRLSSTNNQLAHRWKAQLQDEESALSIKLRLTVAIDIREELLIEARLPLSGTLLGVFDIRYGYALQLFEIPLAPDHFPAALDEGIELIMIQGETAMWMIAGTEPDPSTHALLPHLIVSDVSDTASAGSFFHQFHSLSSIQPFGWMEGCVLEGLYDLNEALPERGYLKTLANHLDKFFQENGGLVYENPFSEPCDNVMNNVEAGLPFSVIAKLWPSHPALQRMIKFGMSYPRFDERKETTMITAEGSLTLAYPLAAIARATGRLDLAELAVAHHLDRKTYLATETGLRLRFGKRCEPFHNWARAYSWYMLGLIRTIRELSAFEGSARISTIALEEEFRRISAIALSYQNPQGLWYCFTDDERTKIDTSGSSGIAAALAIGAKANVLTAEAFTAAERAYAGLQPYLTADGLLTGVAQSNRAGEALQRSGYRVISQIGMGLMAQLAAAIGRGE